METNLLGIMLFAWEEVRHWTNFYSLGARGSLSTIANNEKGCNSSLHLFYILAQWGAHSVLRE